MPDFRFVALSDIHAPIHDQKSLDWAFDKAEQHIGSGDRSVLVLNGDIFEGKATSRHAKDERHAWTAVQEFHEAGKIADSINERFPDALKVWNFGNHDCNFINYNPGRLSRDIQAVISEKWESWRKEKLGGWVVRGEYSHDSVWYLGQIGFRHGCEVSKAAVTKDLFDYCADYGLLVQGHTHRPYQVAQLEVNGVKGRHWHVNTGHHMNVGKAFYMRRMRTTQWGNGVLLGECVAPGLRDGLKSYAVRRWEARLEIRAMGSRHFHG